MKVKKKEMDEYKYVLELENDKHEKIEIQYAGGDLYWTMLRYIDSNEFRITKEDSMLFSQMTEIFSQIEKYDQPYSKLLDDNGAFEWSSEAHGTVEEAHKLTISRSDGSFIIKFFQNPNHSLRTKGICPICFCLSGSKNPNIAYAFSRMFQEYRNYQNNEKKYIKSAESKSTSFSN